MYLYAVEFKSMVETETETKTGPETSSVEQKSKGGHRAFSILYIKK